MHIDPDAFKMMMPEWPDYVARDRDCAGTMCHKESSFMVEVPTSSDRWGMCRVKVHPLGCPRKQMGYNLLIGCVGVITHLRTI